MNICIVTVYNSENCGSFYQAYALCKVLEKQGHNVTFLRRDTHGTSHSMGSTFISSLKSLARGRLSSAFNCFRMYYAFGKATKIFKIVENNPDALRISIALLLAVILFGILKANIFTNEGLSIRD